MDFWRKVALVTLVLAAQVALPQEPDVKPELPRRETIGELETTLSDWYSRITDWWRGSARPSDLTNP